MSLVHPPSPLLRGPVPLVHLLLRTLLRPGSRVVDATCGNGKDTCLLAELVGSQGHVWGLDIQSTALERTATRLTDELRPQVTLLHGGHEHLPELVEAPLDAVIFNLGWLPGADRNITTTTATTLSALEGARHMLAPAGLLFIICYPGHPEGAAEAAAVVDWCSQLPADAYFVWRMAQSNVAAEAPFTLLIQNINSGRDGHQDRPASVTLQSSVSVL